MNAEHLAKEADRLASDPVLVKALDDVRAEALNALAFANADHTIAILRLQQKVAVIDEFRATLARYIVASEPAQDDASPYA